jgi:hypothetical protein
MFAPQSAVNRQLRALVQIDLFLTFHLIESLWCLPESVSLAVSGGLD